MNSMRNAGSAVIFGAADAFGSEIAVRLAEENYIVHGCAENGERPADMPAAAALHVVDADDGISLARFFAETGTVDVLVVNVPATAGETGFLDVSDAAFEGAMRHFLFTPVAIAQAALPFMAPGTRIVFVSSRGYLGAWGGAHLMAASAALVAMARSMSLELAERHIAVNLVAPDFVGSKWDRPQSRRTVANAVSYLASPDSGVSGETLLVDGGRSLRMTESRRRQGQDQAHPQSAAGAKLLDRNPAST
jgi:3-oxoacyl-[acyl-carrier protein] reductase